jgi:hypothetical protein
MILGSFPTHIPALVDREGNTFGCRSTVRPRDDLALLACSSVGTGPQAVFQ